MNEIRPVTISIIENIPNKSPYGFGDELGELVRKKIMPILKKEPSEKIYLSMKGIRDINASFAREAIIKTLLEFKGEKGFCLIDVENVEYLDNFAPGVIKYNQPVFYKTKNKMSIVSPAFPDEYCRGVKEIIDYVSKHKEGTTASMLKDDMNITTIANASTKLKKLLADGYLIRKQDSAPSGGIEYLYYSIC